MRKSIPKTPLLVILRQMTAAQRDEFAMLAGTSTSYLYQLAGCNRKSCRAGLTKGIADASVVMGAKYGTDSVDMDTLATMCWLPDANH
jgi:hypothetical protein